MLTGNYRQQQKEKELKQVVFWNSDDEHICIYIDFWNKSKG